MNEKNLKASLSEIALSYRRFELWRGLALCWGAAALCCFLLIGLSRSTRRIPPITVPVFAAGTALAGFFYWRRFRTTRRDLRQIAREIEQEHPKLNSLLLAAIEQEPDPKTGEWSYLQTRVIGEAIDHHRQNPWGGRILERLFLSKLAHAAALLLCVAAVLTLHFSMPRVPGRKTLWTGTVRVSPGDIEIERGSPLPIMAEFPLPLPPEVRLVLKSPTNSQTISLTKSLDDPIFGGTIPEVRQNLEYHIEYGATQTRAYKIQVFDFPALEKADADLVYPAYTQLPPKKIENTRRVSAVEGTTLTYTFLLNKPVVSARLVAPDKSSIDLAKDPNSPNRFQTSLKLDRNQRYSLVLQDDAKRTNKVPSEFVLDAQPNKRPELKMIAPRGDPHVSALEEVAFEGEAFDDFGMPAYGLAYKMVGQDIKFLPLGQNAGRNEKRPLTHLLAMEQLGARPDQLMSYYLWADDIGPDANVRRTVGEMYFADVRPFEQIFREGQDQQSDSQQQQQQGQQRSPSQKLIELQKDIISATWKLQGRESGPKPSADFKKDLDVIHESQEKALDQAEALKERLRDPKMQAIIEPVKEAMTAALTQLSEAASKGLAPLPKAVDEEQRAYEGLLKLQAREFQVTRNRNRQQQGGGGGGESGMQRQLDELELKQAQNRYETKSQAKAQQTPAQKEESQVLNRLKELARRQGDVNERVKELQTELREARTDAEREEARRKLKRLMEDQQELVNDMDELRQRMARNESSQNADALSQLDKTRNESRQAAERLQKGEASQALAAGARAQQDLQQLRDEYRKRTSGQFTDQMREMRQQARELADKENQIGEKLDGIKNAEKKTLSDSAERKALADQMQQQKSNLSSLVNEMRQVTEAAETVEPVLAKELYDTLRRSGQQNTDKLLDTASELVSRSFVKQAAEAENRARKNIDDIKQGVERAAEAVLGDETESLRQAQSELKELTDQIQQEMAQAQGHANGSTQQVQNAAAGTGTNTGGLLVARNGNSTNAAGLLSRSGTNGVGGTGRLGDYTTNRLAMNNARGNSGRGQQGQGQGQQGQGQGQQGQGQGQQGQGQGQQGQGQGQQGQGQGQQGQGQGQQGQGQGQQGQGQGQGQGRGQGRGNRGGQDAQRADNGQRQPGEGQGQQAGQGRGQGQGRGPANAGNRQAGRRNAGGGAGGGGGPVTELEGPLTGTDFVNWSTRLGDVQEMVDFPDLRSELAQVGDQARNMRRDIRNAGQKPDWAKVVSQIIQPLTEVRNRISEELARRQSSDALVPIDRDPVPPKYTELVREYYEQLGK